MKPLIDGRNTTSVTAFINDAFTWNWEHFSGTPSFMGSIFCTNITDTDIHWDMLAWKRKKKDITGVSCLSNGAWTPPPTHIYTNNVVTEVSCLFNHIDLVGYCQYVYIAEIVLWPNTYHTTCT